MTKVYHVVEEHRLLDDSLRPVWMLLFYNGFHTKMYRSTKEELVLYITGFIFTIFVILMLLVYMAHLIIQLLFFGNGIIVLHKVMILYRIVSSSSAAFFLCYHFIYQQEIFQFLKHWEEIEARYLTHFDGTKKKLKIIMYGVYLPMLVFAPITTFNWNLKDPRHVVFFSIYPIFDSWNIYLFPSISAFIAYFTQLHYFVGEIVPALFFYHVGCVIVDLKRELQDNDFNSRLPDRILISSLYLQFRNEKPFRQIWEKYETILQCVGQGNKLFQSVILCHQFSGFAFLSIGVYAITVVPDRSLSFSFMATTIMVMLRFIGVNWLMSHPYLSCGELETAVTDLLSKKWDSLAEEDRQFFTAFQERLSNANMAAIPFNLYTITPYNLLSVLSLIITYAIVLFQSHVPT